MKEIYYNSVRQFNEFYGFETVHPLVSVVRFDKPRIISEIFFAIPEMFFSFSLNFFTIC
ncbi:MAG: hypothetical protein ACI3ZA_03640 [Alloprevotella sp.]